MENQKESASNVQYRTEFELLQKKNLNDLKMMAKELGVPTSSKLRKKADWVSAIYDHCSTSKKEVAEKVAVDKTPAVSESHEEQTKAPEQQIVKRKSQGTSARRNTQHNQQTGYTQKKQYQNSQGGHSRQQNNQNEYQNGFQDKQPTYRQSHGQQSTYQNQHRQNDRNQSQQQGYSQEYQRKKSYQQQIDNARQQQTFANQQNRVQGNAQYSQYQQCATQYGADEAQQFPQREADYNYAMNSVPMQTEEPTMLDCEAVLEVMQDGYGFLRSNNYLPGQGDVYISNQQVRRFKLHTGDCIKGKTRRAQSGEKYPPLLFISEINGETPDQAVRRKRFDELVPVYPDERLTLEHSGDKNLAIRLIDLFAPIGKGQRGLIVSQPKAGKTTLLKEIANGITANYPDVHLIVLLIDERPEEVTDIRRSIKSRDEGNCEVVYSTFDELPDHHTRVAEMVMERSMRLVERGRDVVVLMDSITRLARAYNITLPSTGKTLSGGMDPSALFKPKRFFGAARNIEGGGSLTIIATALVETGSRMDDMVYEEFKGTGNMEIHLDRKLSEKRIFPAVDIYKSGTRHDDLLLSSDESECIQSLRRIFSVSNTAEVTEQVIGMLAKSANNMQFIDMLKAWFAKKDKDVHSSMNNR